MPFSSLIVAYWLFARGQEAREHNPVMLYSLRQNLCVFVLQSYKVILNTILATQIVIVTQLTSLCRSKMIC